VLLSRVGLALAAVYLVAAIAMVRHELRFTGGGWINLRGFGTSLVTAPSQLTLGALLELFGVRVNWARLGAADYAQLALHVIVSAAFVYALGWGAESLIRRLVR
jgi:hypothetical protein